MKIGLVHWNPRNHRIGKLHAGATNTDLVDLVVVKYSTTINYYTALNLTKVDTSSYMYPSFNQA